MRDAIPSLPDRFVRLFPNAFTTTMASGIIAVDAQALGWPRLRWALFAVAGTRMARQAGLPGAAPRIAA